MDYIDKTVLRLKRQYGKDELVAHLNKKNKELEFKVGELTSEVDELKHELSKFDKNVLFQEIRQQQNTISQLREANRNMRYELRVLKENPELIKTITT